MAVTGSFAVFADTPVVGAGLSGAADAGPGMMGNDAAIPEIPGRVDYFAEEVVSPVVSVTARYSYDQMVKDLSELQSRYGANMKTNVIGTSLDGRNLYEVILGNPNAEKHVLIHAGIHAREYMTPLLVMKQLEYGLYFYGSGTYEGQPLSNLLQHVAVHFVPMANPDGTTLSQFGLGAIRSEELRRGIEACYQWDLSNGRTAEPFETYLTHWKANARGVDLNQNFPANWERAASSGAPSYGLYKGPSALSEPESQALANLVNSREWAATISYHSTGSLIYWDYEGNRQYERSLELANVVSASTGYRLAGSSGDGGFKDWTQIKDNPIASLTIETGSVPCPLPLTEYRKIWYQNKMVWAAVAKYVMEH